MSAEDIYRTPESVEEVELPAKSSLLIKVMAILFSIPTASIIFIKQSSILGVAGGIGGIIGSVIPALIVVLLFQIGKGFRNSHSRWKIFMWSQFVVLLGQISAILQTIGANA